MDKKQIGRPMINENVCKIIFSLEKDTPKTTGMIQKEIKLGKGTIDKGRQIIITHCTRLRNMGNVEKKIIPDHNGVDRMAWALTEKGERLKALLIKLKEILEE